MTTNKSFFYPPKDLWYLVETTTKDGLYNYGDACWPSPLPKSRGIKRHEDESREATTRISKPGLWDQTPMSAGWKQDFVEVLLRNAMQLLLIFLAVNFSTYLFLLFPESLSSAYEICRILLSCVCLYIFTCTHVSTQLFGRVEWCSNKFLQLQCLKTPSPSIPTSPTMPQFEITGD